MYDPGVLYGLGSLAGEEACYGSYRPSTGPPRSLEGIEADIRSIEGDIVRVLAKGMETATT
jgi:hypothetical protein